MILVSSGELKSRTLEETFLVSLEVSRVGHFASFEL